MTAGLLDDHGSDDTTGASVSSHGMGDPLLARSPRLGFGHSRFVFRINQPHDVGGATTTHRKSTSKLRTTERKDVDLSVVSLLFREFDFLVWFSCCLIFILILLNYSTKKIT